MATATTGNDCGNNDGDGNGDDGNNGDGDDCGNNRATTTGNSTLAANPCRHNNKQMEYSVALYAGELADLIVPCSMPWAITVYTQLKRSVSQ